MKKQSDAYDAESYKERRYSETLRIKAKTSELDYRYVQMMYL